MMKVARIWTYVFFGLAVALLAVARIRDRMEWENGWCLPAFVPSKS